VSRALAELAAIQYNLNMHAAPKRGGAWSVTDLGEVAARLGSIVTFDRRGDVYWLDDFEDGKAKWAAETSGAGAGVAVSTTYARNGAKSVELTAGTDMSHYAGIGRLFPYPALSRWGFEGSWSFDSDLETFDIIISVYDGTNLTSAILRYDCVNQKVQYLDSAGAMQDLATSVDLHDYYNMFNTFKLVLDLETGKYERAIANESEYDMAGIALQQAAIAVSPVVKLSMRNTAVGGTGGVVYVDDVIVTRNEPGPERTTPRLLVGVGG